MRRLCSSNHCPDEKGTESAIQVRSSSCNRRSNHCPDEKGTESYTYQETSADESDRVATIAPTKRGLKALLVPVYEWACFVAVSAAMKSDQANG